MVELPGDSLQPLLTWRPGDPGPRPGFGGRGEDLRYMQGTVVRWDPDTAENIIRIRGVDHTNVPLIDLGLGQQAMLPGDQVAIMSWSPNGGTSAYFIMGRLVVGGTTAAQRSAQVLRTLSLAVLGASIRTASVDTLDDLSDTNGEWVDLPTPGPTISGVQIGQTGRALVTIGADIQLRTDSVDTTLAAGYMSFEVSGATNQPPAFEGRSYYRNFRMVGAGQASVNTGGGTDRTVVVTGLNPGEHAFTAKYAALTIPTSPPLGAVLFVDRVMTVIPF